MRDCNNLISSYYNAFDLLLFLYPCNRLFVLQSSHFFFQMVVCFTVFHWDLCPHINTHNSLNEKNNWSEEKSSELIFFYSSFLMWILNGISRNFPIFFPFLVRFSPVWRNVWIALTDYNMMFSRCKKNVRYFRNVVCASNSWTVKKCT